MFERFSDDARVVILHAQEESRRLGHDAVGVEHLLLGVVRTDPTLVPAGEEDVRAQVAGRLGRGTRHGEGRVPFSDGAKAALNRSLTGALGHGNRQIAPEHMLMALLVDEDVAAVLRGCAEPPRGAAAG